MTGVKCNILILARSINHSTIASYKVSTADGRQFTKYFKNNLGVNTQSFGQPSEGINSLSGLRIIDLYFYNSSYSNRTGSSFLF